MARPRVPRPRPHPEHYWTPGSIPQTSDRLSRTAPGEEQGHSSTMTAAQDTSPLCSEFARRDEDALDCPATILAFNPSLNPSPSPSTSLSTSASSSTSTSFSPSPSPSPSPNVDEGHSLSQLLGSPAPLRLRTVGSGQSDAGPDRSDTGSEQPRRGRLAPTVLEWGGGLAEILVATHQPTRRTAEAAAAAAAEAAATAATAQGAAAAARARVAARVVTAAAFGGSLS
ncbi:hypothetical protein T492DRAFT_494620 [Pavlovales sp. CCMP2436]|nr:hypothetical protein T492DRAFT_494620 [Pavlovales sp. CCMP2436]